MGNILGAVVKECISAANAPQHKYQGAPYQGGAGSGGQQSGEDLRQRANDVFQRRNEAFEKSKECYSRGDHAGAKHYSQLGKDLDRQGHALNQQAADAIYQQKNAHLAPNEVDLHGLTVEEAKARVEDALTAARRDGRTKLVLIVGKGLHTKAPGGPKLKPAILEMVEKHNLRCTVDPHNEGRLLVEMVSAEERGFFGDLMDKCTIM